MRVSPLYCLPCIAAALTSTVQAQFGGGVPSIRYGEKVPAEVEQLYERGLQFLAQTQLEDGSWPAGQQGAGITGLCLMAFLAHGEDPNYGRYSQQVRGAVRNVIQQQDGNTGFIQTSMYHHGFAMLALAEAYGAVDESLLGGEGELPRGVGEALELAVRCAVTAQNKSRLRGWRYSPTSGDADTSVSGAVLMGLLAARNAGIEVPDTCIDGALSYFKSCTSDGGSVAYTQGLGGFGDSMNRSAIAALVYAIGKRREWKEYAATFDYISNRLEHQPTSHPSYFRYYMAQALFQGDVDAWTKWKRENMLFIRGNQRDNGSIDGPYGEAYGTSMALLSLALEYRFLPIYER